jgi:hypothetical protein
MFFLQSCRGLCCFFIITIVDRIFDSFIVFFGTYLRGATCAAETEAGLYLGGGPIFARMTVKSIPSESRFSWISGRYLILSF